MFTENKIGYDSEVKISEHWVFHYCVINGVTFSLLLHTYIKDFFKRTNIHFPGRFEKTYTFIYFINQINSKVNYFRTYMMCFKIM